MLADAVLIAASMYLHTHMGGFQKQGPCLGVLITKDIVEFSFYMSIYHLFVCMHTFIAFLGSSSKEGQSLKHDGH